MDFNEWHEYIRKEAKQLKPSPFLPLNISRDLALEDLGDFTYQTTDKGITETFTLFKHLMN